MSRTPLYLVAGSLRVIWRFRLRSALALVAGALAVAGVIISVSYSAGGREQVLQQIRRLGTNVLIVTPAQSRAVGGRARTGAPVTTLVERDYREIRQAVPALVRTSAWVSRAFRLEAGDLSKTATIVGCEPAYFRIRSWPVADGEPFDAADGRRMARVALIGRNVARELYGDGPVVGERLFINRVPFEVIGVLAERGQGLDVTNEDDDVYVPLSTAMHRLMNVDSYNGLLLEIDGLDEMDAAEVSVAGALSRFHHATPTEPIDYQIQNQKVLIDAELTASGRLTFFIWWIALSGLVVAGLGILAIAWIGVKERTKEIGARRAVGATASMIFLQIVFESVLLVVFGCGLGLAIGWYGSAILADRTGLPFVFDWTAAGVALVSAAGLSTLFSLLPARRAARLDPITALTYE